KGARGPALCRDAGPLQQTLERLFRREGPAHRLAFQATDIVGLIDQLDAGLADIGIERVFQIFGRYIDIAYLREGSPRQCRHTDRSNRERAQETRSEHYLPEILFLFSSDPDQRRWNVCNGFLQFEITILSPASTIFRPKPSRNNCLKPSMLSRRKLPPMRI